MKNEEFSDVLKTYGDMAYRMACHLTHGDESLARDLVQDAFVKVWKNWEWQRPQSFKGWMYRILHNLYMDHLRRKSREATVSYDLPGPMEDDCFKDSFPEIALPALEELEREELKRKLHAILDAMPEEFRVPIILCDMEDFSYEEIAQIMSCPVGTVRSRIHRGRRDLRRSMQPYVAGSVVPARRLAGALVHLEVRHELA